MAHSTRASRALLFMHQCRRSHPTTTTILPHPHPRQVQLIRQNSSDTSPYDPSHFSKPLRRDHDHNNNDHDHDHDHGLPPPRPSHSHHPRGLSHPQPTETVYPGVRATPWTTIKMFFGHRPSAPPGYTPAPFTVATNPYRARKTWPPDFDDMNPKQQFHYEKTYRRRAKLAYARPRWNRRVKTLQHTGIILTVLYFVFICEPEDKMGTPFDGFRAWFFGHLKNLGTLPESTRAEAERLEKEARHTMKSRRSLLSGGSSEDADADADGHGDGDEAEAKVEAEV